jgi:hypothetical protein
MGSTGQMKGTIQNLRTLNRGQAHR